MFLFFLWKIWGLNDIKTKSWIAGYSKQLIIIEKLLSKCTIFDNDSLNIREKLIISFLFSLCELEFKSATA